MCHHLSFQEWGQEWEEEEEKEDRPRSGEIFTMFAFLKLIILDWIVLLIFSSLLYQLPCFIFTSFFCHPMRMELLMLKLSLLISGVLIMDVMSFVLHVWAYEPNDYESHSHVNTSHFCQLIIWILSPCFSGLFPTYLLLSLLISIWTMQILVLYMIWNFFGAISAWKS